MEDHTELNDSWEILSTSSHLSLASSASIHSFDFVDHPDRPPLSFKDALLSSVAATGGFRLDTSKVKTARKSKPRILALSPSSAIRAQKEVKEIENGDDSNWGFSMWRAAKNPSSHARDLSKRDKKVKKKK